jgi:alpha-tubulin suppressor-like RCC1 family protein
VPVRQNLVLRMLSACVAFAIGAAPAAVSAQSLAGGYLHSIILKSDGTVWAVGRNNDGQLGDNSFAVRATPVAVTGLTGVTITAVAAGRSHSLALDSSGTLRLWGDNGQGQLGDNSTTDRLAPITSSLSNVAEIAAGEYHTVVRLTNGDVYAWGRNGEGQLGIGSNTPSPVPVLVTTGAIAIGAGHNHTLVVKSGGTVWGTGSNAWGQLGDNTGTSRTSLVQMTGITNAVAVAGGVQYSIVLLGDGTLKAVGYNDQGQLGDGTFTQRKTAVAVSSLTDVTMIAVGYLHTVVRKSDGTVWSWGLNTNGQLGDGTTTNRHMPTQVTALSSIASVAAGDSHSLATDTNGVVFTWGANNTSQLGDGTIADRYSPVSISGAGYDWRVATPVFSPAAATFTANQPIAITSTTSGAAIHYTLTGVDPTESDPLYTSGSLTLSAPATVKAKAWKSGVPASNVETAFYNFQATSPTITPFGANNLTAPLSVTMTTGTSGGQIRYTADGTEPTETSTLYAGAITVTTTTTLKVKTFKAGWLPSATRTPSFLFNYGTLATPTASLAAGTHVGVQTVTLSADPGATIRYTIDNSQITNTSPTYTGPITIPVTTTVKARAEKVDWTTSLILTAAYTIKVPTPTISLPSGQYAPDQTVAVTNAMDGTTTTYTINGVDPVATDPVVAPGQTLTVGRFTLKARATKANCVASDIATATYTLSGNVTASSVVTGLNSSFLLDTDGTVWAWGDNGNGQLGDGTTNQRRLPTRLNTVTGLRRLTSGGNHTLSIRTNGTVLAWGSNILWSDRRRHSNAAVVADSGSWPRVDRRGGGGKPA